MPLEITEFLDGPAPPKAPAATSRWTARRVMEMLLDPRTIEWLILLGGVLAVLGLLVWLVSQGVFENKLVMAAALGIATLAAFAVGWYVMLRTRYRLAGRAVTFLGCVAAPLNLWFYHAQGLVTLHDHLWVGGVVCCLLYGATVYALRDPLFIYAVEAGVMLTVVLLLGELGMASDPTWLSLVILATGLISIHAERAFPPGEGEFTRRRFGMPWFWSGHLQIAAGLAILMFAQATTGLVEFGAGLFNDGALRAMASAPVPTLLAGGLWFAAAYGYLYSDFVVRRHGLYTFAAAFCLVIGELTIFDFALNAEGLIAVLSLTALAITFADQYVRRDKGGDTLRMLPQLAVGLGVLPVALGTLLHFRATSPLLFELAGSFTTGWGFVGAMLVAVTTNRTSAFVYRERSPQASTVFFFLSAASLLVAAAGGLRAVGVADVATQAAILMIIPFGCLLASRLWRGHTPERPLMWIAQTATAVILLPMFASSATSPGAPLLPAAGRPESLLLGFVFLEAAIFYGATSVYRRHGANAALATLCACGAAWQWLGYGGVPTAWYTMAYAIVGVGLLLASQLLGLEPADVFRQDGRTIRRMRGRGRLLFASGNAVLLVALLAAMLQGLTRLAITTVDWPQFSTLCVCLGAALAGSALTGPTPWRRIYATSAVVLAGLIFLSLNVLVDLTPWRRVELFCVVGGVLLIVAGYVGRLREVDGKMSDTVTSTLWIGSMLLAIPLLVAVVVQRFSLGRVSLPDELGLLTASILMLVSGIGSKTKSTTILGGGALAVYLLILVGMLAYRPQVAVGAYLAIAGAVIFAAGVALSVWRERLLAIPDRVAKREGVFQFFDWR